MPSLSMHANRPLILPTKVNFLATLGAAKFSGLTCLTALAICSAIPSHAHAQDAAPPRAVRLLAVGDAPPFRQEIRDGVRYELEAPPGSIPPRQILIAGTADGEPAGPIRLQLGRPTETIQIPAGQSTPLRLLTTTGGEVPVNRPWTEITTYPETGDFLVILWRSPEHNDWDRPLILAIPETAAGHARFINLSPWPAGLEIAGNRLLIPPGRNHLRPAPATEDDQPFSISIPAPDGNPAPIHHGSLLVHSNERALVILYRSDGESPRRPATVITRREPTTR